MNELPHCPGEYALPLEADEFHGHFVHCPFGGESCGGCHMHGVTVEQDKKRTLVFRDGEAVHAAPATNASGHGRGSSVRVMMTCEAGHSFDLRLAFHKGMIDLRAVDSSGDNNDLAELWRD